MKDKIKQIICKIKGHQIEVVNDSYLGGKFLVNRYYPYCRRCHRHLGLPLIEKVKINI